MADTETSSETKYGPRKNYLENGYKDNCQNTEKRRYV